MGSLNKEIQFRKPDRSCPNCSISIPGRAIPIGWGPNSEFECPACHSRLRSRFSYAHCVMSLVLCSLVILGLLWFGASFDDLSSGRSIRDAERRVFVNVVRATLLALGILIVGAIAWLGNRLPHRVLAAEAPDPQGRVISLAILLPTLLTMLLMMVTCVGVIVSSG